MKVRAVVEMEVTNFLRHQLDGMLMESLGNNHGIEGVRVVGAYRDENDNPVSDDFFVVDENFSQVTEAVLTEAGISAEVITAFVESDALFGLHREWNEYISDSAEANMHGREKFTELALKHMNSKAA